MDSNSPFKKNMSVAVKINTKILGSSSPEGVVTIVEDNKERLNNVNITTAIHRIAKVCHRKPQKIVKILPKLNSLISLIYERCHTFSGRQLANSTWGLAIMQFKDASFYSKISMESRKKLNDFEPQHLAILVWSFATMSLTDKVLFEKVALKAIIDIGKFSPQNLSNLAWAFAKMNYCEELLFKNIAAQGAKTIKDFAPQNISNLIWSFGALKINEPELVEKVVDESIRRLEEFNTQNLSNLAWAIAVTAPSASCNAVLFEEIAAVCQAKLDYFNARYFANLVWAFAVVGHYPEALLEQAVEYMNSADRAEIAEMGANYKAQWYQVDLALKLERGDLSSRMSLDKEIRTLVAKDFLKNEIACSEDSVEVNNALNLLQVEHRSNFILDEGFVVSNMLQPESQHKALAFLGPSHFLRNADGLTGEAHLRARLLRANGWRVATVDFREIRRCHSFDQKVQLVEEKLASIGVQATNPYGSMKTAYQSHRPPVRSGAFPPACEPPAFRSAECSFESFPPSRTLDSLSLNPPPTPTPRKEGRSILEGIVYKSYVKRYLKIFLFDVEITKPLGGLFGKGFSFELVEINLMESVASYFLQTTDSSPSFTHPIKVC